MIYFGTCIDFLICIYEKSALLNLWEVYRASSKGLQGSTPFKPITKLLGNLINTSRLRHLSCTFMDSTCHKVGKKITNLKFHVSFFHFEQISLYFSSWRSFNLKWIKMQTIKTNVVQEMLCVLEICGQVTSIKTLLLQIPTCSTNLDKIYNDEFPI